MPMMDLTAVSGNDGLDTKDFSSTSSSPTVAKSNIVGASRRPLNRESECSPSRKNTTLTPRPIQNNFWYCCSLRALDKTDVLN
jgi:hypothetical protein